ncbi:MAG: hypothetical protein ACREBU_23445, partial [Nitrososphaera sp.]
MSTEEMEEMVGDGAKGGLVRGMTGNGRGRRHRLFEKRLLEDIGYGLSLSFDVDTNAPIEPECDYYYQSDKGPWRDPPAHVDTVKVQGRTLIAVAAALFHEPEVLSESKRLMRFILASHIG